MLLLHTEFLIANISIASPKWALTPAPNRRALGAEKDVPPVGLYDGVEFGPKTRKGR